MNLTRYSPRRAGFTACLSLTLWVITLAPTAMRAQTTASMKGTVRDTSGAVVPECTITMKNVETGMTRVAVTDANGSYNVTALPVGQYEVTAEKTGFKQSVRKGLNLVVAQQLSLDMALEIGGVEQQVTVTADAPLVNTTLSSTAGLIGETQVKELPLNGRSF